MPNGPIHTRYTLAASAALAIGSVYAVVRYDRLEALAIPIGSMAGLLLTPDLDVDGGSISDYHARQIGCLFAFAWYWYWRPYAWIAKHRGLSHAPILGTLVRLIYVGWWAVAASLYFQIDLPWAWIGAAAIGLAIVDCVHIFMDWLSKRLRLARKVLA